MKMKHGQSWNIYFDEYIQWILSYIYKLPFKLLAYFFKKEIKYFFKERKSERNKKEERKTRKK